MLGLGFVDVEVDVDVEVGALAAIEYLRDIDGFGASIGFEAGTAQVGVNSLDLAVVVVAAVVTRDTAV